MGGVLIAIGYVLAAAGGFVFGRCWHGRVRCPELTTIERTDYSVDGYPTYKSLERCEQRDWHHGPCSISDNLSTPHYWNPIDEDPKVST